LLRRPLKQDSRQLGQERTKSPNNEPILSVDRGTND
jgi:hypothetical protein